jgi:RNA polymerase sigma factor (TIGR02999 family)
VKSEFSELLRLAGGTDSAATDQLFAALYDELHRLAERHLRKGGSALTLGRTSLVHETYLNMLGRPEAEFPDRARFFAYASRAMRGLMIDYARRRCARKRGRQFEITLAEEGSSPQAVAEAANDLPALGDALTELAELHPDLAELVDLHFFGGFSFTEIARLRGVSERTIQRDWRKARLLLQHTLRNEGDPPKA